jgi:CcmD family protein
MRFCRALCVAALLLSAPVAYAAQPQPQPTVDEFVPMEEVPASEQIPAINLVAAAYGFVWIVVVGYVWSLGRRLQKAESELADLERRAAR